MIRVAADVTARRHALPDTDEASQVPHKEFPMGDLHLLFFASFLAHSEMGHGR
jgi:hypothetical protein